MRISFAITLLVLLGACASAGTYVEPTAAQNFQEGVTTYKDVVGTYGLPQTDMTLPDGTRQIIYVHSDVQLKAATFVPLVGLFAGGADTTTNTTTFVFGPDELLQRSNSGVSQIKTRNGG